MMGRIVVVKVSPVLYTRNHMQKYIHVMDAFDWLNEGFLHFLDFSSCHGGALWRAPPVAFGKKNGGSNKIKINVPIGGYSPVPHSLPTSLSHVLPLLLLPSLSTSRHLSLKKRERKFTARKEGGERSGRGLYVNIPLCANKNY